MSYIVIKCGGSIIERLPNSFFQSLQELSKREIKPILIHGGGPGITSLLEKLEVETKFVNGLRYTSEEVLDTAEMVLSGSINKKLVKKMIEHGTKAVGISGVDGMLLKAKQLETTESLGFVGEVSGVNTELVISLLKKDFLPVISPIAVDEKGQSWNINADHAAAALAKSLNAPLFFITDVPGVLKDGKTITSLSSHECIELIGASVITGGMIPKVEAVLACLEAGIEQVSIINGLEENSLLRAAAGENIGTTFYNKEEFING
jgi:acetylglutamate kinase